MPYFHYNPYEKILPALSPIITSHYYSSLINECDQPIQYILLLFWFFIAYIDQQAPRPYIPPVYNAARPAMYRDDNLRGVRTPNKFLIFYLGWAQVVLNKALHHSHLHFTFTVNVTKIGEVRCTNEPGLSHFCLCVHSRSLSCATYRGSQKSQNDPQVSIAIRVVNNFKTSGCSVGQATPVSH